MRLDQWLWAVRIFKSRSLASEAIRLGLVRLNGHSAKASSSVQPGQTVELQRQIQGNPRICTLHVLAIPPSRVAAKRVPEFLKTEPLPEISESRQPQWWESFDFPPDNLP